MLIFCSEKKICHLIINQFKSNNWEWFLAYRVYPCIYYQLHLTSIRYTKFFVNVICMALNIGALWSLCILLLCSLEYTYFMVFKQNLCAKSVIWNSFENFRFCCRSIGTNDFKPRKACFSKVLQILWLLFYSIRYFVVVD